MKDYLNKKLTVSIIDFGAVSGVNELQTEKIQSAIDHCFKNGGGVVEVPKGEFLTGGVRLRSNVTLHLLEGAILKGSRDCEDYQTLHNDVLEPAPQSTLVPAIMVNGRSIDGMHYGTRWMRSLIKIYRAKKRCYYRGKGVVSRR